MLADHRPVDAVLSLSSVKSDSKTANQVGHLWDIDILINRTLVYGTLTASVIGIYVLVVGALGTTIQGRGNLLISVLATGLVVILVQPLRDRRQRGVNRMMYGERDDPVTVLSRLGQRLEATLAPMPFFLRSWRLWHRR